MFLLEENVKICYLSIDKIENDSKWLIGFALQTRTQTRSFLCLFVVVNLEFSLDLFVSYILDQCQSSFEAPMNIDHYNGTYCAILSISHVFNTRIRKHFWLICNAWVCTKLNTNTDEEKMCVSCVVVVIMQYACIVEVGEKQLCIFWPEIWDIFMAYQIEFKSKFTTWAESKAVFPSSNPWIHA